MAKSCIIGIILNVIFGIVSIPLFFIVRILLCPGSWSWPSSSPKDKLIGYAIISVFALVAFIFNKAIHRKYSTLNAKTYLAINILAFSLPPIIATVVLDKIL